MATSLDMSRRLGSYSNMFNVRLIQLSLILIIMSMNGFHTKLIFGDEVKASARFFDSYLHI